MSTKLKVKCAREECKYEWDYEGNSKWYVSCPRCHSSIKIRHMVKLESKPITKAEGWTHHCNIADKDRTFGLDVPMCPDCGVTEGEKSK